MKKLFTSEQLSNMSKILQEYRAAVIQKCQILYPHQNVESYAWKSAFINCRTISYYSHDSWLSRKTLMSHDSWVSVISDRTIFLIRYSEFAVCQGKMGSLHSTAVWISPFRIKNCWIRLMIFPFCRPFWRNRRHKFSIFFSCSAIDWGWRGTRKLRSWFHNGSAAVTRDSIILLRYSCSSRLPHSMVLEGPVPILN